MFGFGPMHTGHQGRLLLLQTESSTRSKIRIMKNTCDLDFRKILWHLTHLYLVLLHVDASVGFPSGVGGAHERVGHRRLWLMGVIGTVVMRYQTAQAGCGDVPGERATVLLLIARVTRGGRERQREGEQEEERQ